jgi:hypothetical protein
LGFFFWWWLNSISIPSPHKLALFTTGMSCDRFIFGLQNSKAPVLQPVNDRQDPRLSEHEEGQPLLPQHLMHEERDPSICSISTVSTLKKKRSEMILVNLCFYSLHTSSYVVYLFRLLLSIYIYTHTVYVYIYRNWYMLLCTLHLDSVSCPRDLKLRGRSSVWHAEVKAQRALGEPSETRWELIPWG